MKQRRPRFLQPAADPALGRRLRAARKEAGLTMTQAGKAMLRNESWLSKIERGVNGIYAFHVVKLAELYGVSPGKLIDPSWEPMPPEPTRQPSARERMLERLGSILDRLDPQQRSSWLTVGEQLARAPAGAEVGA